MWQVVETPKGINVEFIEGDQVKLSLTTNANSISDLNLLIAVMAKTELRPQNAPKFL